jgi:hypothetical protein
LTQKSTFKTSFSAKATNYKVVGNTILDFPAVDSLFIRPKAAKLSLFSDFSHHCQPSSFGFKLQFLQFQFSDKSVHYELVWDKQRAKTVVEHNKIGPTDQKLLNFKVQYFHHCHISGARDYSLSTIRPQLVRTCPQFVRVRPQLSASVRNYPHLSAFICKRSAFCPFFFVFNCYQQVLLNKGLVEQ